MTLYTYKFIILENQSMRNPKTEISQFHMHDTQKHACGCVFVETNRKTAIECIRKKSAVCEKYGKVNR